MQSIHNTGDEQPIYSPYRWAAADFQLGLRSILPEHWVLIGAEHAEIMRQKLERLKSHRSFCYRTLPRSLNAQQELRKRVTAHLATDHPRYFSQSDSVIRSLVTGEMHDLDDDSTEPLLQLSYLIEEDFMLLEEAEGKLQITAASNAYSSSGRLAASVGQDMAWALEPAPKLTDKIGG